MDKVKSSAGVGKQIWHNAKSYQKVIDYPTCWLTTEYQNGFRTAKDALAVFYGSMHIDISAKNTWELIEASLEIFAEADSNEEWGLIRFGKHGQDCINVKDKWEFLEKYIKPIMDQGRLVVDQYDEITREFYNRCDQKLKEISAAKPIGRPEGSTSGHSPKTVDDADEVAKERAQGLTQQQVANKLNMSRQRVSQLEKMNSNASFNQDNILIKTSKATHKPASNYGTSKAHAIARLKRDGYANLAQQVESGQMTAAAARREAGYVTTRERSVFSVSNGTNAQSLAESMARKLPLEFINDLYSELGKLIQEHHNEHNWIP